MFGWSILAEERSLWLSTIILVIYSMSYRTYSAPSTTRFNTFLLPSRSFSTSDNLDKRVDKVGAGADDADDGPREAEEVSDEVQWEQPGRGLDGPAGGILEDVGAEVGGVGGPERRWRGSG